LSIVHSSCPLSSNWFLLLPLESSFVLLEQRLTDVDVMIDSLAEIKLEFLDANV